MAASTNVNNFNIEVIMDHKQHNVINPLNKDDFIVNIRSNKLNLDSNDISRSQVVSKVHN